MAGVNSLAIVPAHVVKMLTKASGVMLLAAMVAIGVDTNIAKVRAAGVKPLLLAGFLCGHLVVSGYFITSYVVKILG